MARLSSLGTRKNTVVTVVVVSCAAVAVPFLYSEGYFGTVMTVKVDNNAQLTPYDTGRSTRASHMVFEGIIESTDVKMLYMPPLHNGWEVVWEGYDLPRKVLNIRVTEWFKDESGRYPDTVVLSDHMEHWVGKIQGHPAEFKSRWGVEYEPKERAIFFVGTYYAETASTNGALQVLRYDEDGRMYSTYWRDYLGTFDAGEVRADIKAELNASSEPAA